MSEKLVLVGVLPEVIVLDHGDQMVWQPLNGNLRVEFDSARCPFSSNIFQAPAGARLLSGGLRPGTNPGSYKYRLYVNDQLLGNGEVIVRGK